VKRLLITAGPTHEPIDPVRFIGNRSSGRVGISLARAAQNRGYEVTLLMGPIHLPLDLPGVTTHRFQSTADLQELLQAHFPGCDALIMAAAVADYRPHEVSAHKLQRTAETPLRIELEPTPDLVAEVAQSKSPHQRVIAFALETSDHLKERAAAKLQRKHVDAIVANPLQTMDSETIEPTWISASGESIPAESMPKGQFADWLLDRVESL